MQANLLAPVAAFALAALCAFAPSPASAQNATGAYAVRGVQVDETAANAQAAQQAGFTAAQRLAFGRLVARVTLPEERARTTIPVLDDAAIERMVLSVDVEEERRSATRYIGRLSVRFDPNAVRAQLRSFNLTIVDQRSAPILVVPLALPGTAPETLALWRQVFEQGGFGDELVPFALAQASLEGPPNWAAASPSAQAAGAGSALYATLRVQGTAVSAQFIEVSAAGQRDRGELTARASSTEPAALRAAMASLADQVSTRIQNEWKARVAATAGQRGRISASALYTSQQQWERIKQGLEGAAQTMISEIRIEAVGRQGALVSFSFTGDPTQLTADLARRGVRLTEGPNGWELRTSGR